LSVAFFYCSLGFAFPTFKGFFSKGWLKDGFSGIKRSRYQGRARANGNRTGRASGSTVERPPQAGSEYRRGTDSVQTESVSHSGPAPGVALGIVSASLLAEQQLKPTKPTK